MPASDDGTGASLDVYLFSYHEHDWTVEDEEEAHAEFLRRARLETWVPVAAHDDGVSKRPEDLCDVEDLDALQALMRETLVADWGLPLEGIELPLAKLSELMKREGRRFVGGCFNEFEGHHNDSEIRVVLTKPMTSDPSDTGDTGDGN